MTSIPITSTPDLRTPLAVFRYAANLSQAQLAEAAGISRVGLANIERGESAPRLATAQALSDALGVPVEELFPTGEPTPSKDEEAVDTGG